MAITRQEFCKAEGGDRFVDAHGYNWHILHRLHGGVIPGLKARKGSGIVSLFWHDNQIVDQDFISVNELTRHEARLVPA